MEDASDYSGGFLINNPLISGFIPEIAVNDRSCEMPACFAFGLKGGTDFATGVSGVILVHDIAERGKIIVPSGTVHTVIDSNKTDATLAQDFHDLTDFQIVTTHTAHVLDAKIFHISGFHFLHHGKETGTVKAGAADAIVRKMDWIGESLLGSIFFKQLLLIGDGIAFTVQIIVTAQTLVKSCDFLAFYHRFLLSMVIGCVF